MDATHITTASLIDRPTLPDGVVVANHSPALARVHALDVPHPLALVARGHDRPMHYIEPPSTW